VTLEQLPVGCDPCIPPNKHLRNKLATYAGRVKWIRCGSITGRVSRSLRKRWPPRQVEDKRLCTDLVPERAAGPLERTSIRRGHVADVRKHHDANRPARAALPRPAPNAAVMGNEARPPRRARARSGHRSYPRLRSAGSSRRLLLAGMDKHGRRAWSSWLANVRSTGFIMSLHGTRAKGPLRHLGRINRNRELSAGPAGLMCAVQVSARPRCRIRRRRDSGRILGGNAGHSARVTRPWRAAPIARPP
jgi:hypothetical protein